MRYKGLWKSLKVKADTKQKLEWFRELFETPDLDVKLSLDDTINRLMSIVEKVHKEDDDEEN